MIYPFVEDMSTVGIVIPAYRPHLPTLVEYVSDLRASVDPAEIRVELDDPTPEAVEALRSQPVTLDVASERRGKGAAIAAGFDALETDSLVFVDADGATPASDVAAVVGALDTADVSVGSRRHPDATVVESQSVLRATMGDAFAWLARRALPVRLSDYQCGAKAVSRPTWHRVRPFVRRMGYDWDVDFLAVAAVLGHHVVEVPVTWHDKPGSTVDPFGVAVTFLAALVDVNRRSKVLARSEAGRRAATPRAGLRPEQVD